MSQNQDNFLDIKSLMAIFVLVLCWLAWDYHMKQKYPEHYKSKAFVAQNTEPETQKEPVNPTKQSEKNVKPQRLGSKKTLSRSFLHNSSYRQKELWFKGENFEILFSSEGLGIKKIKLNKYFKRDGTSVEFENPEEGFFSTHFLDGPAVPFEIKKEGDSFVGLFSTKNSEIKKQIQIDDKNFVLNVKTEILPKSKEALSGLQLLFSHPLPKQENSGLFGRFLIYGTNVLKAFVFYEGKETDRLTGSSLEACQKSTPCKSYSNSQLVALGGKYFGKAFINKSELLPKAQFQHSKNRAKASVSYNFLHSKKQELNYQVFVGPKSLKTFQNIGGDLRLWLDFGFFSWLARPLLLFLTALYALCHNWGLAIILLTIVIRLALLPINMKSYKSMKVMQQLQPQIKELKSTYKSDPKKMNQEVMALMKQNKANPLGGCLPMFLQLPVFFALYRVLGESIELYQSPFFFWVQDLSLKDPYYVYPILGGLVLFVQQSLTPMNLPKEQARLIKIMPLVFSVFMLNLPSGLTIYIFASGLFGLAQQYFFVRTNPTQN